MPTNYVGLVPPSGTGKIFTEASIDFSSSGDNEIIAAVAGKTIRVFRLFIVCASVTNIIFKDGSTALTGAMRLGSLVLDFQDVPWFIGTSGAAFNINSDTAVQVGGRIWYAQ